MSIRPKIQVPDASFCEGNLKWTISGASTGFRNGQIGTAIFKKGKTTIVYTITDTNNNSSQDSLEINVFDNEKPRISASANKTVFSDTGECSASGVDLGTLTTSDNCEIIKTIFWAKN